MTSTTRITTFHTSGAIAGIEKCSYALRIPTTRPLTPSRTTIGNRTRLRPTVSSSRRCVNWSPVNSGMITPAARMKNSVIAPRIAMIRTSSVRARRNASLRLPCSSSSVKTGTNAALSAASANSERTRLGTWKAMVKALNAPDVAKYDDATISRTTPAIRDRPVAALKMAVLRAMPLPPGRVPCVGFSGSSPAARVAVVSAATGALSYGPPRASSRGVRTSMANIHSQKKRILRAQRERLENRRYTSTIKTYFRRLEAAVGEGDDASADTEHRALVQTVDKAVTRGALHRNTGARKKFRAARVRAGQPSA